MAVIPYRVILLLTLRMILHLFIIDALQRISAMSVTEEDRRAEEGAGGGGALVSITLIRILIVISSFIFFIIGVSIHRQLHPCYRCWRSSSSFGTMIWNRASPEGEPVPSPWSVHPPRHPYPTSRSSRSSSSSSAPSCFILLILLVLILLTLLILQILIILPFDPCDVLDILSRSPRTPSARYPARKNFWKKCSGSNSP